MKNRIWKHLGGLAALILGAPGVMAQSAADDEAATIEYLKSLDFIQLQEVEVSLDDVFDVFDGLVNRRKVKVASGVEQSMSRAPSVTTVITAQDIEATGANDLDEILESVPGLHVSWDNLYSPIYSIRGLQSLTNPEVLLLINGIPMRDLTAGNRGSAWGGMPIRNIARIEIIRGPGSAVHGADAFSGVINVLTKQAQDIQGTETGGRVGSNQTYDTWALHGGTWAGMEVAAAVELQDSDGPDETITTDRQSLMDSRTGTSASFAPGPVQRQRQRVDARVDVSKDHWRLRAGFQGRDKLGTGPGAAQSLDPEGELSENRYNLDLTYHNPALTPHWEVNALLSFQDRRFEMDHIGLFPPGTRQPFPGYPQGVVYAEGVWQAVRLYQRYSRLELDGLYSGWRGHVLRLGAGYTYDDAYETGYTTNRGLDANLKPIPPNVGGVVLDDTPAVIVPEELRKNAHGFIQDTYAFADAWELTAGLRYDEYSDFGNTFNPRAALVWQTTATLTTKLLYGEAFRAPSFRELYVYNNIYRGNASLKPESLSTWELAFDWLAGTHLNLTANVFRYEVEDKILFTPLAGTTLLHAENRGTQSGQGIELEARWKVSPRASLLVNFAHARNKDEREQDIGDYPQHSAYLRGDWLLWPNWYLNAQGNWISSRNRQPGDSRPAMADYTSVDLSVRYKNIRTNRWNFALGVRNLFDSDRRESISPDIPEDLPLPGREFFVELRYRF